jgi:hypothetical protein
MERGEYIQKRRRKYLAQVMDFFDERIATLIPEGADQQAVDDFRGLCRAKFNALAVDANDVMNLDNGHINAFADEVKDRLHSDGRTATARS